MAQLLLISDSSLSDKDNRESGDIVGIYDDSHVFSKHELEIFTVVKFTGDKELVAKDIAPEARTLVKAKDVNWGFEENLERKEAWKDSKGSWIEVVEQPRFVLRYEDGAIKENYTRYEENKTTTLISSLSVEK
jgi:hypothetical protein